MDEVLKTTGIKQGNEMYSPDSNTRDFLMRVYSDFVDDYSLKYQTWEVLNGRTLDQFWADSNYDYNVIVTDDPNNPVTQYSSGVSRDKANMFISNLTLNLLYPSITALNTAQEIDTTISRIGRPILKFQYLNDGRPSESGKVKNVRYTHKQVVEGTVHILDVVGSDGRLTSSITPNEEVFIPNFYQPDLQLLSHFMRVQQWGSYAEAEAEFGECPNWKYVTPGSLGWLNQTQLFKEQYKALNIKNQASIIRCWYPVKEKEVARLKNIGTLPKWVKCAKYFNVVINGVNMFPYDNLMPYHHGKYPITKAVFEHFSPAEFYWGNSQPNKARQDKRFLDGWKTLMRYKGKLSAIPALLNFTGHHVENDVVVPGIMTDVPGDMDPNKIVAVPGTAQGMTQGDAMLLRDTNQDIERATAAPQTSGRQTGGQQTARETMVIEGNAQKILQGFAQQIAFREEARAFPILKSSFQFLPRQDIKKLAIPDETFDDGTSGTLEIIFKKLGSMTPNEQLNASYEIKKTEQHAAKNGNAKRIMYVDPEYVQDLEFYAEAIADELPAQNSTFREAKAEYKWNLYSGHPETFNVIRAARKLARELGDNDKEMVNDQSPQMQSAGNPGMGTAPPGMSVGSPPANGMGLGGMNPMKRAFNRNNQSLLTNSI